MSQADSGRGSAAASGGGAEQSSETNRSKGGSTLLRYARRGLSSGVVAGAVGGVTVLRGLRAFQRGERARGLGRILVGGLFVAIAVEQRRRASGSSGGRDRGSAGVEESDVVDTAPDLEGITTEEAGSETDDHATGDEAASVAESSVDVEDAATESGTEAHATGDEAASVAESSVDVEDAVEGSTATADDDEMADEAADDGDSDSDENESDSQETESDSRSDDASS